VVHIYVRHNLATEESGTQALTKWVSRTTARAPLTGIGGFAEFRLASHEGS